MPNEDKSLDVMGIKPIGESAKILTKAAVDGAAAFFGRICLPAAEEFGLMLRDKVHAWRTNNVASVAQTAERLIGDAHVHAHPRLVSQIVDEVSWIDDQYLQDMWAGLLASSCTDSGDDDSNVLFVNLLADMTKLQSRVLNYICSKAPKHVGLNGLPYARQITIDLNTVKTIAECDDVERIDRELDRLNGLDLVNGGFGTGTSTNARVTPTALALHLYIRCQGSRQSPVEYFGLEAELQGQAGDAK